jgi:hypothetical protein
LTANYRVYVNEADAKQVFAYIQHKQASSPVWIAGVYNCTAFLADIANYMGLRAPATATWMYPENFVNSLRDLNGGRQEITLAATSSHNIISLSGFRLPESLADLSRLKFP